MADVPLKIRRGPEFTTSWVVASDRMGRRSGEFDNKVKDAVDELLKKRPGFGVPTETPEHTAPIMAGYEVVYEWATDFNEKGIAVAHYLVLLLIQHK